MPLRFKGRNLHAHQPNQYRLENDSGKILLTHNNISGHSVYHNLLNNTNNNNKTEMRTLGRFIANKIKNERNIVNTKHKLNSMVQAIINHRKADSKSYEAEYLRAMETYRRRVAPLWAARTPHFNTLSKLRAFTNGGGKLSNKGKEVLKESARMNKYYSNLISAEEKVYERVVKKWMDHQAQIKYWQWVKNRAVPEAKRLLLK